MKKIPFLLMFIASFLNGYSQQIGIGTTTPNTKALLDLTSNNKGLLVPRMTAVERIAINPANPAKGLLVFDTDSTAFMFWTGIAWQKLANTSIGSSGNAWTISGNTASSSDVLGTLNNQPLVLVSNGLPVLRLQHLTTSGFHTPNITMGSKGNAITRSHSSAVLSGGVENLGYENTIDSSYYTVIGGGYNQETYLAGNGFIGGGVSNAIKSVDGLDVVLGTIAGGGNNSVSGNYGAIAGGSNNNIFKRNGFIGGGFNNNISGDYSTITGGNRNNISSDSSFIGGGSYNNISGSFSSVIAGGFNNSLNACFSVISGGNSNSSYACYTSTGGGYLNYLSNTASYSVIAGGYRDSILSIYSTVSGGQNNKIQSGSYSSIGGGLNNFSNQEGTTISGGRNDSATGKYSVIGGGRLNYVKGDSSVIAGGYENTININAHNSFIGGGSNNLVHTQYSVISGGRNNITTDRGNTIGGGENNKAQYDFSTIAGGLNNLTADAGTFIGGGESNTVYGLYGTVSGGYRNKVFSTFDAIAGGNENLVDNGSYSFIGGGDSNIISNNNAVIGGGLRNRISVTADYSVIAGGRDNRVEKTNSFIGGGDNNWSRGQYSSVMGGNSNEASGDYSVVLGGAGNVAGGLYGLSAGRNCENQHTGVVMFADNQAERFASRVTNQLMIRMTNGMFISQEDTSAASEGYVHIRSRASVPNLMIDQVNTTANYARIRMRSIQNKTNYWDIAAHSVNNEFNIYRNGTGNVLSLTPADPTNLLMMSNNARLTIGGTWTNASDRNVKDMISPVNEQVILKRLVSMPLSSWHYKAEQPGIMHIGPMAQDFKAAFGLGDSDRSIATIDADGINMAAIKALYAELENVKKEMAALKLLSVKKSP